MTDGPPTRLGADVIRQLIAVRHPMIMVDAVTRFDRESLSAERYVSANEPAFVGHFPGLKLWPGVHTMEGLRQCCALHEAIQRAADNHLLDGLRVLNDRYRLRPRVDDERCRRIIAALEELRAPDPASVRLRIKLQVPVFAGCRIDYEVRRDGPDSKEWSVRADVDGKCVASGEIAWGS